MKQLDLCIICGVEEDEVFVLKTTDKTNKFKIHDDILVTMDTDGEWIVDTDLLVQDLAEGFEVIKLKQFSEHTLNFFKCIDKRYEWISKDKNGNVYLHEHKPIKKEVNWFSDYYHSIGDIINQSLFEQILWEDEEPIYIPNYVVR